MAVAFLDRGVQWYGLVLADIPVDAEVLALANSVERLVETRHDLLVGTALEWYHLALVIEAQVEPKDDLDAALARLDDSFLDGARIQCRRLTARRTNVRRSKGLLKLHEHEHFTLCIFEAGEPCDILRSQDVFMTRHCGACQTILHQRRLERDDALP